VQGELIALDVPRRSALMLKYIPYGLAAACSMAWPGECWAQTVGSIDASSPPVARAADPSLGHAAAKGVTLKVATTALGMTVFSVGTGSLWSAGVLTMLGTATSYVTYVTNEYLWDTYAPNTNLRANSESFNTGQSLWRNSGKYLTFKPAVVAVNWAAIYLYTASAAATVAMGSVYSLTVPAIYYLNNVGWDWYDWYSGVSSGPTVPPR